MQSTKAKSISPERKKALRPLRLRRMRSAALWVALGFLPIALALFIVVFREAMGIFWMLMEALTLSFGLWLSREAFRNAKNIFLYGQELS